MSSPYLLLFITPWGCSMLPIFTWVCGHPLGHEQPNSPHFLVAPQRGPWGNFIIPWSHNLFCITNTLVEFITSSIIWLHSRTFLFVVLTDHWQPWWLHYRQLHTAFTHLNKRLVLWVNIVKEQVYLKLSQKQSQIVVHVVSQERMSCLELPVRKITALNRNYVYQVQYNKKNFQAWQLYFLPPTGRKWDLQDFPFFLK